MSELTYTVFTRGRMHRPQTTLEQLAKVGLIGYTTIMCSPDEASHWHMKYPEARILPDPPECFNIGFARAYAFLSCKTRYHFMIDDDIQFSHRYEDGKTKAISHDWDRFRYYIHDHVLELFKTYPAVAIGSRLFCQERPMLLENKQNTWAWGHDRHVVTKDLKPAFNRLPIFEDIDWNLTLLEAGHKNVVASYLLAWGRDAAVIPQEGGVGLYRTTSMVEEQVQNFYNLHKDVVRIRTPRPGLPASTQYRLTIQWKKAFGSKCLKTI